jgi:hypothetical protein
VFSGRTPQEEARDVLRRALGINSRSPLEPWLQGAGGFIPYTQLPEVKSGEALAAESNTYRREVGRLLAEGQEGRHVLIKGETILGIYDTWKAARKEGLKRFRNEPFLARPILAQEPLLRVRGSTLPCPS